MPRVTKKKIWFWMNILLFSVLAILFVGFIISPLQGRVVGILFLFICFASLVALLSTLNYLVPDLSRKGSHRFSVGTLCVAGQLTFTMFCIGIVGGTVHKQELWRFPLEKALEPATLVGTLLGFSTILALIITFAEVNERWRPRAMSFEEGLREATEFIKEYHVEKKCDLLACSYYPPIGVVNRDEYSAEHWDFCQAIAKHKVKCLTLGASHQPPDSADGLRELADTIQGRRPTSYHEAVAAFSKMWYWDNDENGEKAFNRYKSAIERIEAEMGLLTNSDLDLFRAAQIVPDFHFFLACKNPTSVRAGLLLIPLRPAGMPVVPHNGRNKEPPLCGMEIHEPEILYHLLDLWKCLKMQLCTESQTETRIDGQSDAPGSVSTRLLEPDGPPPLGEGTTSS